VLPHLYGTAADIDSVVSICKSRNILLFEDCAQAVGASKGGKMLGTYGDAGVYSFGALKNINAVFGGALLVKDKAVLENIEKKISTFPLMSGGKIFGKLLFCLFYDLLMHPWVYTPLSNSFMNMLDQNGHVDKEAVKRTRIPSSYLSQMTSMQASLVLAGLKTWQEQAKQSRKIASDYNTAITCQTGSLWHPVCPPGVFNTYLQFPIWVDPSNQKLKKWLRTQRVDINVDFFRDVSSLDCFSEYRVDCPNTKSLLRHLALLPTYPRQDAHYTRRVSKALEEFMLQP
jgi:dTDP-4-amino-4,6-dideoxygalactose transaminase